MSSFKKNRTLIKQMIGKKALVTAFILLFLILNFSNCSRFSKKERYIVATSPNNPPMEMVSEDRKIQGFDIDVINGIAELMDMELKIIPVLRGNLIYGLIDETYDIAISSFTTEEEIISDHRGIAFSTPYLSIGEVIVLSEDIEIPGGLEDLVNKTVGIITEAPSKKVFQKFQGIGVKEYDNIEQAFEDMASDKIDAVCAELPIASQFVYFNEEFKNIFYIHSVPVTTRNYVIAVKKGNTALINKINTGIEKMKRESILEKLINKWFFPQ